MTELKKTDRTRVKRAHLRGHYDKETAYAIIDAALLCHVGYIIDGSPYVTPTCHWREGNHIYWHGSSASRMLRTVTKGVPVCLTVSHLDGLVLARSGFHHSVNYRSVMLFGEAKLLEGDDAKLASLKAFTDRITPGRWEELRPVNDQEMKGTSIAYMEIDEGAAKIRAGGPVDDEPDYDLDIWAGVLPFTTTTGAPIPDARNKPNVPVPDYLADIVIGENTFEVGDD